MQYPCSVDFAKLMHPGIMEYEYSHPGQTWDNSELHRTVLTVLEKNASPGDRRILEIGCGNGYTAGLLAARGYAVTGIDPSRSGIREAREKYPEVQFHCMGVQDEEMGKLGRYPVVVSLEVIEHCSSASGYIESFKARLAEGGLGIISTPYHGYLKNLVIAVMGRSDSHYDPLWEGGHVKFWSKRTLGKLLDSAGFTSIRFLAVGRVPLLAKSMVAVFRR